MKTDSIHTLRAFIILVCLWLCTASEDSDENVVFETSAWQTPPTDKSLLLYKDDLIFLEMIQSSNEEKNKYNELKGCYPTHVHLALADQSHHGMTISFSIPSGIHNDCDPIRTQIYIQYGTTVEQSGPDDHGAALTVEVDATSAIQYNATSVLTDEYYTSDWIYHVPLTDLIPDTKYWYSIHVKLLHNTLLKSSTLLDHTAESRRKLRRPLIAKEHELYTVIQTRKAWFRSAPRPQTRTKIAIVGDLGQTYNSTVTMLNMLLSAQVQSGALNVIPTSLILCAGDMSYANSIQSQWDTWFTLLEPLVQSVPFHVAAGNHEVECDAVTKMPFQAYEHRFHMPNRIANAIISPVHDDDYEKWKPESTCATPSVYMGQYDYGNAYYSFEYGYMKVIVLSSYSANDVGSRQYTWLVNELKSTRNDRERTPWVIIMMHTQFYTTFKAHNDEKQTVIMKHAMEPLFKEYGVNIVVSGHDHAYMRTKAMYEGQVDPSGKSPVYFIVGEGGNREGHVKSYLHEKPEPWVEVRDLTVFGFGTLDVMNATHAKWQWNMDGRTDGFKDDVWLENQFLNF